MWCEHMWATSTHSTCWVQCRPKRCWTCLATPDTRLPLPPLQDRKQPIVVWNCWQLWTRKLMIKPTQGVYRTASRSCNSCQVVLSSFHPKAFVMACNVLHNAPASWWYDCYDCQKTLIVSEMVHRFEQAASSIKQEADSAAISWGRNCQHCLRFWQSLSLSWGGADRKNRFLNILKLAVNIRKPRI